MEHSDCRNPVIRNWRRFDNVWLRRTTLRFQLSCKLQTDEALLFPLIK
ncbi:MAG: DNA alkylation repair protein [Nodosilinea sp. WJT8-NPBG4]|nr:DNA alkylation repair protein [Nodosilinea sp. WJT8-NPBG4]